MNEYGFYYASYNPDEYIIKKKSLEVTNYLKKENDTVVENVLPHAFAVTQFHIVYMFPKNITVLSKISREIVYS
jgi:putative heme iron utilization protein